MPDLANLLSPTSLTLSQFPNSKPPPPNSCDSGPSLCINGVITPAEDELQRQSLVYSGALEQPEIASGAMTLEDHVRLWKERKLKYGVPQSRCLLPFLHNAPKLDKCLLCQKFVYPGEEALCSVRGCGGAYHIICAKQQLGFSRSRKFKCPQHVCFVCNQKLHWRCVRCPMASHNKCAAWPEKVKSLISRPGRAVCWRHPADWRSEKKSAVPVNDVEEVFDRLPLPYVEEEFKVDLTWKSVEENDLQQPHYVHIRRNVYLVKKKRDSATDDIGCESCSSTCCDNCVCRVQSISCSKACRCSEMCTNRPFRKEKKINIVKTKFCGWGVEAAESLNKGDFVIEYTGEVIDDALCEQRLWDMKYNGVKNFYMCEIRKNFTIDATFKGNASRFLNHSCDPNCKLEKWQVDGETRVGVFAARAIAVGESLTYDYRFVQFGPEVKCCCEAPNCQGYLGTKRKLGKITFTWGLKRRRTYFAALLS